MSERHTVVGIGELLWDLFPDGAKLGGAPANFAYHAAALGDDGVVVSRLGEDDLGREARSLVTSLGLKDDYLQSDAEHPTGTVVVELREGGQPEFTITRDVAWDYLAGSDEPQRLAARSDCVCFGSLAQRAAVTREAIAEFVRATPEGCIRIFDVNLRQDFFTREVLAESLSLATVAKLNDEELPRVTSTLGLAGDSQADQMKALASEYALDLVCVTRGAHGCMVVSNSGVVEHPGFTCEVADTVGAGDAFTAAFAHHLLRGSPVEVACEVANRMGSYVASKSGATPQVDASVVAEVCRIDGRDAP